MICHDMSNNIHWPTHHWKYYVRIKVVHLGWTEVFQQRKDWLDSKNIQYLCLTDDFSDAVYMYKFHYKKEAMMFRLVWG